MGKKLMPIFLDRHDMVEQSAEETAKLHLMLRGIPVRTLTPQQVAELRERFPI